MGTIKFVATQLREVLSEFKKRRLSYWNRGYLQCQMIHIVYRSGDGHIQEIRLQPGTGCVQADLSAIVANNPPAIPAESNPFAYVTPDNIPRIVYC